MMDIGYPILIYNIYKYPTKKTEKNSIVVWL